MEIKRNLPRLTRWLHIYLSMLSFAIVFFFAVTGLTLNHAERFNGEMRVREKKGKVDRNWTNAQDTLKVAKLEIVESLRRENGITAPLRDLRIDDAQIGISFKGPGYEADVFVNRESGDYELTETSGGFIGIINDLHKGRDTGTAGSVFVDVSAVLLALVSLTGLLLLLFLKKRRTSGLLAAVFGLILFWLIYAIWIK